MSKKDRIVSYKPRATGPRRDRKSRRNVLVIASLLGSLILTSVLLLALAPDPLIPGPTQTLFAPDSPDSLAQIFETRAKIAAGRWQYIFIHHSRSPRDDATSVGQSTGGMGDHFLIGNGNGCADGEIQIGQRWDTQETASPTNAKVGNNCISICLVGDLDRSAPTAMQLQRLEQLVQSLQSRCNITSQSILLYDKQDSPIGVGQRFPRASFLQHLQK